MVFPLYDDNSDRTITPVVNYAIIAVNILVFVFLQQLGTNEQFTYSFSTVPYEILTGHDVVTPSRVVALANGQKALVPGLGPTPISVYLTLITSMFMHGGIAHIGGNMLFLWIFGDNIEDKLGHLRYLVFYLVCGLLASLAHVFTTALFAGSDQSSLLVPSLGASGAISGVLGAYILLYPKRRVTVILFRFLTDVPAYVAIGIWFAFQLISGLGMLGGSQKTGVAYAAHVGGFIAGVVLIKVFLIGHDRPSYPYSAR